MPELLHREGKGMMVMVMVVTPMVMTGTFEAMDQARERFLLFLPKKRKGDLIYNREDFPENTELR